MLYRLWSRAMSLPTRWSRPQAKQKNRSATPPDRPIGGWVFGWSEAKVIFGRRVRVIRVVPRRPFRVQGPREAVVRLPAGQDGPPGGADPGALHPAPPQPGSGRFEHPIPRPGRGHGEDAHLEAGLPRFLEAYLG